MKYSVAMSESTHRALVKHLVREDGQEDVCYALWSPAVGAHRKTALIVDVVLPSEGERLVHGNASTTAEYLDRVIALAKSKGHGVAFLHSHPFPGWQGMSPDDLNTEERQARALFADSGLPLVGMTVGTDEAWSARFWIRTGRRTYSREWCENVRVLGEGGMLTTFCDEVLPPPQFREELKRTISAWGGRAQQMLARLCVGVVGIGSVGAIVAECVARMGIQHIKLIDFDTVARHNLDRLLHAGSNDAANARLKIDVIGDALEVAATAERPQIDRLPLAITEEDGFREAIDCDVLFSCVDRPWPRHVLNYIAYAYRIPVVDGGILIRMRHGRLRQASWRSHVVYPGKRCLVCLGQYDLNHVNLERQGDLDDPRYIETLPEDHSLRRNENVFPFSAHLASTLVMHALHVALQPAGIPDVGNQIYHFPDGSIDVEHAAMCDRSCFFASIAGLGDSVALPITGTDLRAAKMRLQFSTPS